MASEHGTQQPQGKQMSAVRTDDAAARGGQTRARTVVDPLVVSRERGRQDEVRRQFEAASRQHVRKAISWLLASVILLSVFTILNQAAGLSGWLVAIGAAAVIASAGTAARARQVRRAGPAIGPDAPPDREHAVQPADLDEPCRATLNRAQRSIDEALPLLERMESEIDRLAAEVKIRESEWVLAQFLRELTRARARYRADPGARRDSSRQTLEKADAKAARLADGFEEYATRLRDAAARPSQGIDGSLRTSDGLLGLAVSTEIALDPAIQQITELTEAAAKIRDCGDGRADEDNGQPRT